MTGLEHALALLLVVTLCSVVGRWIRWPLPMLYLLAGAAAASTPFFPRIDLDPAFFFVCFLPPLLFSDGWLMPLRELAKAKGQILLLATGLVAFTTMGVGLVAHWLVPGMPLAMGIALGAIVSPTDAVAVAAITEKVSLPARLRIVLNGESLLNDATGLVAFKFALAAVAVGGFSPMGLAWQFVLLAAGGLLVGLVVAYGVGRLRDLLRGGEDGDPLIETTLSLLTPFAAYFAADALGTSPIMSIAAAGLYSGWRDPVRTDAQTRQYTWSVWMTVAFWLNGLAFVLLGLQLPRIVASVRDAYSAPELIGLTAAIAGTAILLRIVWFFPAAYLPFILSRRVRLADQSPSWKAVLIGSWAGMRGAVTLAAAMSIPLLTGGNEPFPSRDLVIFLASGVVVTTLLLQGATMPWLIRRLGIPEDGMRSKEERLARIAAVESGLRVLRASEAAATRVETLAALRHVTAEYEHRLAELTAAGETRANAMERRSAGKRFRCAALQAEREAIDRLWRENIIADDVHRPLQQLLDHEEAMLLGRAADREEAERPPGTSLQ